MAKVKQDKALDNIERGLNTLKDIGEAMNETIGQQDIVLDEIDTKVYGAAIQSSLPACCLSAVLGRNMSLLRRWMLLTRT